MSENPYIKMCGLFASMSHKATCDNPQHESLCNRKEFTKSIRDFELAFKEWRNKLPLSCSCGRGVAVPPNVSCDICIAEWRNASAAAKRAVQTKRARYTKWPTRARNHQLRISKVRISKEGK